MTGLTAHREAFERAAEALLLKGVALCLPRKESQEDRVERALAAFYGARAAGHAVYAFASFGPAPFRKGPVWRVIVSVDHREDESLATTAVVEALRAEGLPVTWNGRSAPLLELGPAA